MTERWRAAEGRAVPAVLAAWTTASHTERAPHTAKPQPPPAPPRA